MGSSATPVASSIDPPARPTSAASAIVCRHVSGSSPKPFSKSAETGNDVASTIIVALTSVSSRSTAPSASGLPRENANPALVVARASKPNVASILAEPASHGFGITNRPGLSCSALKASARFACIFASMETSVLVSETWVQAAIVTRPRFARKRTPDTGSLTPIEGYPTE